MLALVPLEAIRAFAGAIHTGAAIHAHHAITDIELTVRTGKAIWAITDPPVAAPAMLAYYAFTFILLTGEKSNGQCEKGKDKS
ncbi:MAG: hypothetical protein EOP49_26805 [Sphingobacteriales bacterium]|nr:MAG: hypothetical protein EOP49_26805 [Sphingobacteriales bacterium]